MPQQRVIRMAERMQKAELVHRLALRMHTDDATAQA
jgi:hypothetical protein